MRVVNIDSAFTSVYGNILTRMVCGVFGKNNETTHSLMPPRPTRFLQLATWLLIVSSALVSVALSPARDASPQSPLPIDFSFAGYEAGRPVPFVKGVLVVKPSGGDDTALLQGALDRVASMSAAPDGFRGAILLSSGRFRVKGQLHMRVRGVVLRGAGSGANGTVVVAEGIGRRTLIEV